MSKPKRAAKKPTAQSHNLTVTEDDDKYATLNEVFEGYGKDSKTYLLTWASSVAKDAGRPSLSLHSIALHHFLKEHAQEFIADPDDFSIPTEEEDEIVNRILLSIEPDEPINFDDK
jgi:hypothetical protein